MTDPKTIGCACATTAPMPAAKPSAGLARLLGLGLAGLAAWYALYSQLLAFSKYLAFDLAGLTPGSHLGEAVQFFVYDTPKVLMLLVLVVFGVGLLRSFITVDWTRRFLAGKRESAGNVLAALLGVVTPFCSCSAVPLFIGFVTAGVPLGVTFSFLISAPMVNEIALVMLYGLLGWKIAALYFATGIAVAIVAGWTIGRLKMEKHIEGWVLDIRAGEAALPGGRPTIADRLRFGFEAVRDIVGRGLALRGSWGIGRGARASTATCRKASWPGSWARAPGGRCRSACSSACPCTPTPRASSRSSTRFWARARRSARCWPS